MVNYLPSTHSSIHNLVDGINLTKSLQPIQYSLMTFLCSIQIEMNTAESSLLMHDLSDIYIYVEVKKKQSNYCKVFF